MRPSGSTAAFLLAHGAPGQGGSGTASLLILAAACGGSLDPFADAARSATTKAVDQEEGAMALLEKEAIRFAESLNDYEHVSAVDIGGTASAGFWLVVRDHRFELDYSIESHCDYWDFIGALVDHTQYKSLPVAREAA